MAIKKIVLSGVVGWDIDLQTVQNVIDNSNKDDTIEFYLNSGGGYIAEGVAILNYIRMFKGRTIAKVAFAASMMTQIALSCDEVQVFDNSIFMIHNAQGFVYGDYHEMRKKQKLLEGMNNMLSTIYAKKTKKDKKHILDLMDNETWIFGEEIIQEGFADKMVKLNNNDKEEDIIKNIGTFSKEDSETSLKNVEKAQFEEHLSAEQLKNQLIACFGSDCNLAAMPSEEKLANSKKRDVMDKKLQEDLDKANTLIKELQDSNKKREEALKDGVENAKLQEVNRIKEIMNIGGIKAYETNEEVQNMIFDGKTTVAEMKAFLFDLSQVEAKKTTKEIEANSKQATRDMLDIQNKDNHEYESDAEEAKFKRDAEELDITFID